MTIKQKINNFIERAFNDKIIAVQPIEELWITYRDIGTRLEAYYVSVTYKYRGNRKVYFSIDNDHWQIVTAANALKNAQDYYQKIRNRINTR